MKTNYVAIRLSNLLKAFALLCVFTYTSVNAQEEEVSVEITAGTPGILTWYAIDEVVTMTGTATLSGGDTFDVSFTVTPASGQMVGYDDIGWASTSVVADKNTFRASTQGFATLGNISFSNFTGGLTSNIITASTFTHALVGIAHNANDRFTYQVGATEYVSPTNFSNLVDDGTGTGGTIQVGNPTSVDLLTYGPIDVAGGTDPLPSLSEFVIRAASTRDVASDRWTINSITVKVTADTSLGVNDPLNVANAFELHPNPANSTILLNMPISSVKIMDVTGKVVKTYTDIIEKMDVSDFASGIYVLKALSIEGIPLTSKFVIK